LPNIVPLPARITLPEEVSLLVGVGAPSPCSRMAAVVAAAAAALAETAAEAWLAAASAALLSFTSCLTASSSNIPSCVAFLMIIQVPSSAVMRVWAVMRASQQSRIRSGTFLARNAAISSVWLVVLEIMASGRLPKLFLGSNAQPSQPADSSRSSGARQRPRARLQIKWHPALAETAPRVGLAAFVVHE